MRVREVLPLHCIALFDSTSTTKGALPFRAGASLKVVYYNTAEWWTAQDENTQQGLVQANHLVASFADQPWFRGPMTAAEADSMLARAAPGLFVVRTEVPLALLFVISVKAEGGVVMHVPLEVTSTSAALREFPQYASDTVPNLVVALAAARPPVCPIVLSSSDSRPNSKRQSTRDFEENELEGTEYVVLYEFAGTEARQLPVAQGSVVHLVRRETSRWLRMRSTDNKQEGLVPADYVTRSFLNEPWYRSLVTAAQADAALGNTADGAFIVRLGEESPVGLVLSYRAGGAVHHAPLERIDMRFCLQAGPSGVPPSMASAATVAGLVRLLIDEDLISTPVDPLEAEARRGSVSRAALSTLTSTLRKINLNFGRSPSSSPLSSRALSAPPVPPMPELVISAPPLMPVVDPNLYIALKPYSSGKEGHLALARGDRVNLIDEEENDLLRVRQVGSNVTGLVPAGYVTNSPDGQPWFHGEVDQEAAEKLLETHGEGCYLVRESEGFLIVSFRTRAGDVQHLDILSSGSGVVLRDCGVQRQSLLALLQYYSDVAVRDSWGPLSEPVLCESHRDDDAALASGSDALLSRLTVLNSAPASSPANVTASPFAQAAAQEAGASSPSQSALRRSLPEPSLDLTPTRSPSKHQPPLGAAGTKDAAAAAAAAESAPAARPLASLVKTSPPRTDTNINTVAIAVPSTGASAPVVSSSTSAIASLGAKAVRHSTTAAGEREAEDSDEGLTLTLPAGAVRTRSTHAPSGPPPEARGSPTLPGEQADRRRDSGAALPDSTAAVLATIGGTSAAAAASVAGTGSGASAAPSASASSTAFSALSDKVRPAAGTPLVARALPPHMNPRNRQMRPLSPSDAHTDRAPSPRTPTIDGPAMLLPWGTPLTPSTCPTCRELQGMLAELRMQQADAVVRATPARHSTFSSHRSCILCGRAPASNAAEAAPHARELAASEARVGALRLATNELDKLLGGLPDIAPPSPLTQAQASAATAKASAQLAQLVRDRCGISFGQAKTAVQTVLEVLLTQADAVVALSLSSSIEHVTAVPAAPDGGQDVALLRQCAADLTAGSEDLRAAALDRLLRLLKDCNPDQFEALLPPFLHADGKPQPLLTALVAAMANHASKVVAVFAALISLRQDLSALVHTDLPRRLVHDLSSATLETDALLPRMTLLTALLTGPTAQTRAALDGIVNGTTAATLLQLVLRASSASWGPATTLFLRFSALAQPVDARLVSGAIKNAAALDTVLPALGEAVDLENPDEDTSAFFAILGSVFEAEVLLATRAADGQGSAGSLVEEAWGVGTSTELALLSKLRTGLSSPRAERGADDLLGAAVMLRILSSTQALAAPSACQTLEWLKDFLFLLDDTPASARCRDLCASLCAIAATRASSTPASSGPSTAPSPAPRPPALGTPVPPAGPVAGAVKQVAHGSTSNTAAPDSAGTADSAPPTPSGADDMDADDVAPSPGGSGKKAGKRRSKNRK